jgi:hypothetical protein
MSNARLPATSKDAELWQKSPSGPVDSGSPALRIRVKPAELDALRRVLAELQTGSLH